jgi:hypothetical protein
MNTKKYPKVAIADLLQRANDLLTLCRRDHEVLKYFGLTDTHTGELDLLMKKSIELTTAHSCIQIEGVTRTSHYQRNLKDAIKLRAKLVKQLRTMISIAGSIGRIAFESQPKYCKQYFRLR